jgi:phosphoribosylglycinamide formyltransferase-1
MSLKIAVLASGRGSNLESILRAIAEKRLDASVETVISNKEGAGALQIAQKYGVKAKVIPSLGLGRKEHEEKIYDYLKAWQLDYLVLAGYMRIITPYLLGQYPGEGGTYRVVNIHPSLLPAFPGANAYEDAFNYGVKISGITIHLVDDQVDHGPIIAQEAFKREPKDSLDTFKARGLAIEHELYPRVLQELSLKRETVQAKT